MQRLCSPAPGCCFVSSPLGYDGGVKKKTPVLGGFRERLRGVAPRRLEFAGCGQGPGQRIVGENVAASLEFGLSQAKCGRCRLAAGGEVN